MRYRLITLAFVALVALPVSTAHAFGTATSISVSPSSLHVTADQSVALTVTAKDASNTTQNVTGTSTFSTNDPRGSFSANTYQAGKVGTWKIIISYQGLTASVPVTVTAGALAEISILPDSRPEIIPLNRTTTFSVQGFDVDNNRVAVPSVTWSVSNNIASISSAGKLTPQAEGTAEVVATVGNLSNRVGIQVVAARDTIGNVNAAAGNSNGNSNANGNTNTSTNENANVNAPANSNINTPATGTTDSTPCSSRTNWLWGVLLLALLGAVAVLYAFVPVTKTWPPIVGLGAAVVLSIIERKYGCPSNAWWPWIAILGSAGLTVFAFQQSPKNRPPV